MNSLGMRDAYKVSCNWYWPPIENRYNYSTKPRSVCLKLSVMRLLGDQEMVDKVINFPVITWNSLVIVNDHYRYTPTNRIIKALRDVGKILYQISFMIATGYHLPPNEELAIELTGANKKDEILFHNGL